jgi:hypothetical protein
MDLTKEDVLQMRHVYLKSINLYVLLGIGYAGWTWRPESGHDGLIDDATDYPGISEDDKAFLRVAFDYAGD